MRTRTLNQSQLDLLHILYRFRFGTRSLLATYLEKPNNTSLYSKLSILERHGLIASRYNSSYKLAGREAEYFVIPSGVRVLRVTQHIDDPAALQASYKDKTASDQFIRRTTLLFKLRNTLTAAYPSLKYFTARDIHQLDYFPKKRPTAYFSCKEKDATQRFFLEYLPAQTPTSAIKNRIKQYTAYYDEDAWGVTETPFPIVLYVCEDGLTEKGVLWHIQRERYKSDTDIHYYTTTQKALLSNPIDPIWTNAEDTDELLTLTDI